MQRIHGVSAPQGATQPAQAGTCAYSHGVSTPLAARPLTQPHPSRLPESHPAYAEILEAHGAAMAAGLR